jgi:aminomethyltransferase
MQTVRDLGRYRRSPDQYLPHPLDQPSPVWQVVPSGDPRASGMTSDFIRNEDPAGILRTLEAALGPASGTCILGSNVIGVTGWRDVPLARQNSALRIGTGAFVASNMLYIRVSGSDAARCLDMLTPRDITSLDVGRATFAIFTTPRGTVDEEAIVMRLSKDDFLMSCGGGKAPSWLRAAVQLHPEASVTYPDTVSCNFKGPSRIIAAKSLLRSDCGDAVDSLKPFHIVTARTVDDHPVWILKTAVNLEFWGAAEHIRTVWQRILEKPDLITPCGWDALNGFRLDCRQMIFAVYPIDIHGDTTLWEAGYGGMGPQGRKSRFIGDNALRSAESHQRLWLAGVLPFSRPAAPPPVGEPVFDPMDEIVGFTTTAAYSPRARAARAFAHLKTSCSPGSTVRIGSDRWMVSRLPLR